MIFPKKIFGKSGNVIDITSMNINTIYNIYYIYYILYIREYYCIMSYIATHEILENQNEKALHAYFNHIKEDKM